ncbi:MAG: HEAT repeat domain-containing protein, partial [Planctomycetota bacterium]
MSGWELWWEFNQDRFLDLRNRRRAAARVVTGSDDFILGEGGARSLRGLLSRQRLRAEVAPALLEAAGEPETAEACLLALARIGEDPRWRDRLEERLSDRALAVREAATIGLGILGFPQALAPLRHLLANDAEGRALAGGREVSTRIQTFAALALALLGRDCDSTRFESHPALLGAIEAAGVRRDVRAASVLALGILPP